jgi:phosphoglycolate phosphatase
MKKIKYYTVEKMLLIIDLDGTIIDSHDAHINSFVKAIKKAGLYAGKDIIERIKKKIGVPSYEILRELLPDVNDVVIKVIRASAKQILFNEELEKIKLLPNAKEFLQTNSKEHTLALATSADKEFVEKIFEKFKLKKYFKVVVTADDIKNPKPDPEIINKILEELNYDKNKVIFFGDTIYDYKTSVSAGVRFVAVTGVSFFTEELVRKCEHVKYLGDFKL